MGMIQTILKSCKPEADATAYLALLMQQAQNLAAQGDQDGDKPESASVIIVNETNFETLWSEQENIRKTPEIKEKYRQRAIEKRLFAIEIDW